MALALKRVSSYVPSAQEDLLRLLLTFWPNQITMKVGFYQNFTKYFSRKELRHYFDS